MPKNVGFAKIMRWWYEFWTYSVTFQLGNNIFHKIAFVKNVICLKSTISQWHNKTDGSSHSFYDSISQKIMHLLLFLASSVAPLGVTESAAPGDWDTLHGSKNSTMNFITS